MAKVLFFGELKSITGSSEIQSDATDIHQLRNTLLTQWPQLQSKTFSIAVNRVVVHDNIGLAPGDEVACMPPFSGG